MSIRVCVVDDHEIVRTGLTWLLEQELDMAVVGQAGNAADARVLLAGVEVDVLVLDYRLSGIEAPEFCRELVEQRLRAAVLVHSAFLDEEAAWRCISAGARGYVVKDASSEELFAAIRSVAQGELYLDRKIAGRMMGWAASAFRGHKTDLLSPAVLRVLRLAVEGNTNVQIAALTGLSVHTVKSQLTAAYRRLGVRDRTEAAAAAVRLRLL